MKRRYSSIDYDLQLAIGENRRNLAALLIENGARLDGGELSNCLRNHFDVFKFLFGLKLIPESIIYTKSFYRDILRIVSDSQYKEIRVEMLRFLLTASKDKNYVGAMVNRLLNCDASTHYSLTDLIKLFPEFFNLDFIDRDKLNRKNDNKYLKSLIMAKILI